MRRTLFLTLLTASVALAQSSSDQVKIGDITVTGSDRTRVYAWDWFTPPAGNNEYSYVGNLLRLNLAESRGSWDWDAEFAAPVLLGLPNNATAAGAAGRAWLGLELLFGKRQSPICRDAFCKAAVHPIQGPGRQRRQQTPDRAFRIQRRRRIHAEERDAGEPSTRSSDCAADRHVRIFRCRPQLRWRSLFLLHYIQRFHGRHGASHARRLPGGRLGME